MSLVLYQIADDGTNGIVTPDADARIYACATADACGMIAGAEVTWLGTNQLQVASGWGIVHGRCFKIEKETIRATTSSSGTRQGRLLVRIDLAGSTPIQFVTQVNSTLPALTQQDLTADGTIYELPLATYTVTTTSVSNLQNVAPQAGGIYGIANVYYATLDVNSWTDTGTTDQAGNLLYQQTAALSCANSHAPAVTADSVFLSGVGFDATGVADTDDTLAEVLEIINQGYTVTASGAVLVKVREKPTASIRARWTIQA